MNAAKARFLESMDDDFNTAGAIASLHELASEINGFIERKQLESTRDAMMLADVVTAARMLRALGELLGLFRVEQLPEADDNLSGGLMQLIIDLRKTAREKKDFATSDAIRDGLKKLNIIIEDRADGTTWRKE